MKPTTKIRLVSSYEPLWKLSPTHVCFSYASTRAITWRFFAPSWGIWILLPSFGPTHYPPMNLWEIFNTLQVSALESWYLRLVGLVGGIDGLNFGGWYAKKLVFSLFFMLKSRHFWHHDLQHLFWHHACSSARNVVISSHFSYTLEIFHNLKMEAP